MGIILLPFVMVYSLIVMRKVRAKAHEASQLVARFARLDPSWDVDELRSRVREAFFAIQAGWAAREQSGCEAYMSERLHRLHETQLDAMRKMNRQNVMAGIQLSDLLIVQAADRPDDGKDSFWVFLKGSMSDYEIDTTTGKRVDGDEKDRSFSELWRFVRDGEKGWVADEIDSSVSLGDLKRLQNELGPETR